MFKWLVLFALISIFDCCFSKRHSSSKSNNNNYNHEHWVTPSGCGGSIERSTIPEGYHRLDSKLANFYKYHDNDIKTWNDAKDTCRKDGGHLVVINSRKEAEAISAAMNKTLYRKNNQEEYKASWTGVTMYVSEYLYGNSNNKEKEWITVLGDSLTETGYNSWTWKWHGQPDNIPDNSNCVTLDYEIGLDNTPCYYKHPFFCEIPTCKFLKYCLP